jgi:protein-glutamine gamma-glutamyltransferase
MSKGASVTSESPKRDRLTIRCSMYFGLFAVCVAGLLGLGQESWGIPILVSISVVVGLIYTDRFGWFSLNRFFVYILMIAGAFVAILQYMTNPGADRLLSVGNLLVYVQLPLIFQIKAKRVFEQWGVFLLLELVVAALVNDNVLYGVLMVPVLAIGCAAMMTLAQYSSYLQHDDSRSESTNIVSRWLRWFGMDPMLSKKSIDIKLASISSFSSGSNVKRRGTSGWGATIIPITLSVFVFSAAFFYALPRTQVGAYQTNTWGGASVGFADQVSLRFQGDIQQNELPAFRMVMMDESNNKEFRPSAPPYIRMVVLHKYFDGPAHGLWQRSEAAIVVNPRQLRKLPAQDEINDQLEAESDRVIVSISEKASFAQVAACIPPYSRATSPKDFFSVRRDWRMVDVTEEATQKSMKRRYSFRTYGFYQGSEKSLLPDLHDALQVENGIGKAGDSMKLYAREELTDFPTSLSPIISFRETVLEQNPNVPEDKYSRAKFLENYLATSTDFKYSLRITPPVDPKLDPIVDFLLNKKKGHCEYYASALAMLLRSMNVPTRLVSGYRPSEYNEIGKYFPVLQKHAHVWVEAYFTVEELKQRNMGERIPDWVTTGMWVRLDPTPAGDGNNGLDSLRASGSQAFGMIQELWSELVMNVDKSRQSNVFSLFAEASEESYDEYWANLKEIIEGLRSSELIGGLLAPDKWFSWRAAVIISIVGALIVAAYKVTIWLFPNLVPRIAAKRKKRGLATRIDFYNRLTKALNKLGLARNPWETPQEHFVLAANELKEKGILIDGPFLAETFYGVRFGLETISEATKAKIMETVTLLERMR